MDTHQHCILMVASSVEDCLVERSSEASLVPEESWQAAEERL